MNENSTSVNTAPEDYEPILPAGWGDGSDIFDPASWANATAADAQKSEEKEPGENGAESFESLFRAIGQANKTETEDGTDAVGKTDEDAPATGEDGIVPDSKLRFTAQVDHTSHDVELDPSEVPALWEKAQALDRYKERLRASEKELAEWDAVARQLNYDSRTALRDGVIDSSVKSYIEEHPAVPEDMARDYLLNRYRRAPEDQNAETNGEASAESGKPARDFRAEVDQLFRTFKDARMRPIPDEVTAAAVTEGKPLVQAYSEYIARKAEADALAVKKENKILKQNQASAARAPVTGVNGGGATDTKPIDPFLQGFNSDEW